MDKRIRLASDKLMEASLDIEKAFVMASRISEEYSIDPDANRTELKEKMEFGCYELSYDIRIIFDYILRLRSQIKELEEIINK